MEIEPRLTDIRNDGRLGLVGTIPLYPNRLVGSSAMPPFHARARAGVPHIRRVPAYAQLAFTRLPWAAGDPTSLRIEQLPESLTSLGLDLQVSVDAGSNPSSHPEAPGADPATMEEVGSKAIVFRRPSTSELNAGYTDEDYIVATPSVLESPLGRKLPVSRTLFGSSNTQNEITTKRVSGDQSVDTPMYGDASQTISDLVDGGTTVVSNAFDKLSNLNLSPSAKKALGTVATGLGALGLWKVGSKFLPSLMMRNAVANAVGSRSEIPTASPASEAIVQDALVYGSSGNTSGSDGFRAVYEVPMDFWRTLYALGDVYESTASQPHFGFSAGDPSEVVAQTSLFALRAPDVYLTPDGRIVHSPIPYAATVLAGGLFSKLKSAAKKVASVASKVVSKVASNPLVQTAAGAMGMGAALKAVQKGAEAVSKLTDSKASSDSDPTTEPAPDSVAPAPESSALANSVQREIAPVDISGDGASEQNLPDATIEEIQDAVRRSLGQQPDDKAGLPGTWRDYIEGKNVTPEAFATALSMPGSPLTGAPAAPRLGMGKRALAWLTKTVASLVGWTLVDTAISPDSSPYAAPGPAEPSTASMTSGGAVSGSSAKGGFWRAVVNLGKFIMKSTGKIMSFASRNPRATGIVVVVCGFLAVGSKSRKDRARFFDTVFGSLGDLLTALPEPDRDDVDTILECRQWLSAHRDQIVAGGDLSEAEMQQYERCVMVAGLGASAVKDAGDPPLTNNMKNLLKYMDDGAAELIAENKAQFDEACSAAAATLTSASAAGPMVASPDEARQSAAEALAGDDASGVADDDGADATAIPTPSDEDAADDFISDDSNAEMLQDAAMQALLVDTSLMNDREAETARKKAITDFLIGNTNGRVSSAVAASVAGSLLAMLTVKGLAKGKEVAKDAFERARSWWRSSFGLDGKNGAIDGQDFRIGV